LCTLPNVVSVVKSMNKRWVWHVAGMGRSENAYEIVIRKCKGKILIGRTKPRWKNDIKMDLNDVGWRVLEICLRMGKSDELL